MDEQKENKFLVRIEITENGPMTIKGDFVIKDLKRDFEDAPGEIRLCLCGKTKNKPFCDDSHLIKM